MIARRIGAVFVTTMRRFSVYAVHTPVTKVTAMTDMPPPAGNPYGNNPYGGVSPLSPADEKLWATLIHLGGILFNFLPALLGYLLLKDRGPFIRAHTATALNFQITLVIAYVAVWVLGIITAGIGFILAAPLGILSVILMIIAAVAANKGQSYTYPFTITFVS